MHLSLPYFFSTVGETNMQYPYKLTYHMHSIFRNTWSRIFRKFSNIVKHVLVRQFHACICKTVLYKLKDTAKQTSFIFLLHQ